MISEAHPHFSSKKLQTLSPSPAPPSPPSVSADLASGDAFFFQQRSKHARRHPLPERDEVVCCAHSQLLHEGDPRQQLTQLLEKTWGDRSTLPGQMLSQRIL